MLVSLCVALVLKGQDAVALTPSMGPITTSVKIRPGNYLLADKTGKGAIEVGADGVTIDFQGATLSSPDAAIGRLERLNGVGLSIVGRKNITIKNAHIHGFQFNIKLLRCSNVRLESCEVGESRSQRITEGEIANNVWLDLRGLESWRGYGAGIWVEKSSKCVITGIRANQSQNGLILVRANDNKVVGCDFSYNSGWGIALNNSSNNLICWNHADFVNRPWAGFWGGDSAGVVLTSGSNQNTCAYNSFTHSGDGFFLATENGGFDGKGNLCKSGTCDKNQIAFNDGSWSTSNAFESTFSNRNVFYRNQCNDSNYGFWLGYSCENLVEGNQIKRNHIDGIAHEQGAKNLYLNNDIEDTGDVALHLWSGTGDRFKQCPSTANAIVGNHIVTAKRALDLTNSTGVFASNNGIRNAPTPIGFKQISNGRQLSLPSYKLDRAQEAINLKPADFKMYRDTGLPRGWQWLAPTAYGVRDYRTMTAPWVMNDSRTIRLQTPPQRDPIRLKLPDWMTANPGDVPDEVIVSAKPDSSPVGRFREFKIEVTGGAGKPQLIVGKVLDIKWRVRWFKWFRNSADAYSDASAWASLFAGQAIREEELTALPKIEGYHAPEPGLPSHHFALAATTQMQLSSGKYRFDTLSDDGIQVLVDGKLVVNNWTHHAATQDSGQIVLGEGVHSIEVHYCQEDGGAALAVKWEKT